MIENALVYPTDGDRAGKTLVIGIALSLFSFLLLPAFIVLGYFVRILRQGGDETAVPPVYEDWAALLVDGLRAFLVVLGYFVVPVLLIGTALIAFVLPISTFTVVEQSASGGVDVATDTGAAAGGMDALTLVALIVGLLLVAVSSVSLLVAFYALPAGLARFAETDRMGPAFAIRRLWPVLTTGSYAIAWLLALVVTIGAGMIVGVVSVFPILGFVAGVAVTYYGNVVAFRLYGQGYAKATPVEDGPKPSSETFVA